MARQPVKGGSTPWGPAQTVEELKPGIWHVTTASHGGIVISDGRLGTLPPEARQTKYSQNGWFEEDCDWAIPVWFFRGEFKEADVQAAKEMIQGYHKGLVKLLDTVVLN